MHITAPLSQIVSPSPDSKKTHENTTYDRALGPPPKLKPSDASGARKRKTLTDAQVTVMRLDDTYHFGFFTVILLETHK